MKEGLKLSDIATQLGLTVSASLDGEKLIYGLNTLEEAKEGELSFLANPKYAHFLASTKATAVIVHPDYGDKINNALLSENPYLDFARALAFFAKPEGEFTGISPLAFIHPEAKVGEDCTIYPFAYIAARASLGKGCKVFPGCYIGEDVNLGEGCRLYPQVTILAGASLGRNCTVHPGVVLGSDGFGFVPTPLGIEKIPQIGTVNIGDNVELGANTAIDRAALGQTMIGKGTKVDNLVQIGHNVRVGEHCLLVSQVGISGSTRLGNRVVLAGQAGLSGHLTVGDGAVVGPQAGVAHDIKPGEAVGGTPSMPKREFLRSSVLLPRLPELYNRIKKLEDALQAMSESLEQQ